MQKVDGRALNLEVKAEILHLGEDDLPLEIEILNASKVVELGEISIAATFPFEGK